MTDDERDLDARRRTESAPPSPVHAIGSDAMVVPSGQTSKTPPSGASSSEASVERRIRAGTLLRQYEIIRPLGQGGMSEVYLARDTHLGRLVALKLLLRHSGELAKRFLTEARAIAQLSHENIVVIYELGEHEGTPFMALEYLKGKTLREWLKVRKERGREDPLGVPSSEDSALPPSRAAELMIPVVRALVCAHEHGIVHRDLKPPNILLTDTGVVKVLDFGIAKLLGTEALPDEEERSGPSSIPGDGMVLTRAGETVGTLPYMSPEQWGAGEVDARADVWAMGILLAELVLGRHPLAPLNSATLRGVRDLDRPMPSLRATRPELRKIASIIDRCLLKHKEDRLGSARELLTELEALVPAVSRRPLAGEEEAPYPGLSAFQEGDAARFFGRDRAIYQALTRLAEQPLLAVIGPSGAGKSSFVRAGIIPVLKLSGDAWEAFLLRPGPHPLSALAELLAQHAWQSSSHEGAPLGPEAPPAARASTMGETPKPPPQASEREAIVSRLSKEPGFLGVQLRARARRRRERILLFIDQLEEAYTLSPEDERAALFACLAGVADDPSSPLRVVLTLRSDFLDRLTDTQAMLPELGRGFLLLPLDRSELRDALTRPVTALDHRFEPPGLVEEMLDELSHTRGALPLLQFTAARLWERRDASLRALTEASYRALGGVAGTLARHADAVLSAMTPQDKQIARALLLRLVTPERTRALASLRDLLDLDPGQKEIRRVLDRLLSARLLTLEGSGEDEGTVELVHESLVVHWPTLTRWLDEDAEDASFLARLRSAAREWRASGERDGLLWSGEAAEEARRFSARRRAALTPSEGRFLAAVVALDQRARRRRRRSVVAAFALLSAAALLVSYLAVRARQEARRAEREARRAEEKAAEVSAQKDETERSAARARNASRMAAAEAHQSDPTMALALVREIEPGPVPRGWPALARWALDAGVARVVMVQAAEVHSVVWSSDGRRVATASQDRTVRIWSADGAGEPLVLRGHADLVFGVAWSPDGRRIVSASQDKTVRIWDADGSGEPLVLRGHQERVNGVAWSPDGRHVATASSDKTVRIWNADGSGEPLVLRGYPERVNTVAWSPDGRRVATSSYDKIVRIWNADGSGEPLVLRGHGGEVLSATWSPDGTRVVSTGGDQSVRIWDARSARELLVLHGHRGQTTWATFRPDGRRIASASRDRTVRIWDATGAGRPLVLHGHEGEVRWATFRPDGRRIASASQDKTVRIWNADGSGEPLVLRGHEGRVWSAVWSPDGRRIVSASFDKTVRIWNADGTGAPFVFRGHEDLVNMATFSPDGHRIASASHDKTVRVWNADGTGEPLVLRGHERRILSVDWSPDGQRLVSASDDKTVRIWNADGTGEPLVLRTGDAAPYGAAFSPDGRRIASGCYDFTVRIWDADGTGKPIVLHGHEAGSAVMGGRSWSPDGLRLLSFADDGTIRIWNTDGTGEPIVLRDMLESTGGTFNSAAWSPDGRRIVAAADSRTVWVWDDFEPPRGPDDPRIWSATRYCPSIEERQRLLDVTEEMAHRDLARCEQRVRDAGATPSP